jgi:hypothetical protein
VRRAFVAALIALGACGPRARAPAEPPPPPTTASPLGWLPAELVTAIRAPAAGAPMLAFVARSPRRPPCVDAALAGVRESLELQRARGAPMALVLVGALDRDRLEACGVETARALLGLEVTARRDGALTIFERGGAAAQVAGFDGERAVLADTAAEVRAILHPARAIGPADPLGPLLPRLSGGALAAVTVIDYLAPWTKVPARGATFRLERPLDHPPDHPLDHPPGRRPALRAEARVRYADPADARRARDALAQIRVGARADAPFTLRQALALLEPAIDGAELACDLDPILTEEHAGFLPRVLEILDPPDPPP